MDKKSTKKKSPVRLLVNAESFGFGPSAAIASFFPYLREKFDHISYVGTGHSLDLQRNLPYDAIYDISDPATSRSFEDIVAEHDVFLTALDFERAKTARECGKPTIIYDPLTWYWPNIPDVARDNDTLYLAQDFHGVKERLEKEADRFNEAKVVPPIIPKDIPERKPEYVLINLGGLQNPFWSTETAINYARTVIKTVKENLPEYEHLVIVSSEKVAEGLKDLDVQTFTRDQMTSLLPKVKYAVMTSGLGNIYDVAGYDIPTIFLPPANDSQALQLEAMKRAGTLDASIDWRDINPDQPIDYSAGQPTIIRKIADAVVDLENNEDSKHRFADACKKAIDKIVGTEHSTTSLLIEKFGRGGEEKVANAVADFAARFEGKHGAKIVEKRDHAERTRYEGRL